MVAGVEKTTSFSVMIIHAFIRVLRLSAVRSRSLCLSMATEISCSTAIAFARRFLKLVTNYRTHYSIQLIKKGLFTHSTQFIDLDDRSRSESHALYYKQKKSLYHYQSLSDLHEEGVTSCARAAIWSASTGDEFINTSKNLVFKAGVNNINQRGRATGRKTCN